VLGLWILIRVYVWRELSNNVLLNMFGILINVLVIAALFLRLLSPVVWVIVVIIQVLSVLPMVIDVEDTEPLVVVKPIMIAPATNIVYTPPMVLLTVVFVLLSNKQEELVVETYPICFKNNVILH
jgi:hypothetical protein